MLFRRIAFIGVMLAAIAAGVIQVRLMNSAALRKIHLDVARQQDLQRQLWQQEMELARLRTPQRITDRLTSTGTDFLPPGAQRRSDLPPRQPETTETSVEGTPAFGAVSPVTTSLTAPGRQSGGSAHSWPNHPTQSPKKRAR